jgi:hypothetical protein
MASTALSKVFCAVMITTAGAPPPSARTSSSSSSPEGPGMRMSRKAMSKAPPASALRAASPESASTTSQPTVSRASRSTKRIPGSSSATSTRAGPRVFIAFS